MLRLYTIKSKQFKWTDKYVEKGEDIKYVRAVEWCNMAADNYILALALPKMVRLLFYNRTVEELNNEVPIPEKRDIEIENVCQLKWEDNLLIALSDKQVTQIEVDMTERKCMILQ